MDSRTVTVHIRSVVKSAYETDVPETFESIGISMVSGAAAFVDRYHIEVNGLTFHRRTSSSGRELDLSFPPSPGSATSTI